MHIRTCNIQFVLSSYDFTIMLFFGTFSIDPEVISKNDIVTIYNKTMKGYTQDSTHDR